MDKRLLMAAYGIKDPYADQNAAIDTANAMREIQANLTKQDAMRAKGDPLTEMTMANMPYALSPQKLTEIQSRMAPDLSPTERWMRQAQAMAASPNPVLQKAGLQQISQAYAKQADLGKPAKRSTFAQEAIDLGYAPGSEEYKDHIKSRGRNAPMFEKAMDKPVQDYSKWEIKDPITGEWRTPRPSDARTVGELYDLEPRNRKDKTVADFAKIVGLELGLEEVDKASELIYSEDGSLDEDVLSYVGVLNSLPQGWRSGGAWIGKKIPGMDQGTLERAMQFLSHWDRATAPVLRTETGAEAPPHEVAGLQNRFMPQKGDTAAIVKTKENAYKKFVAMLLAYQKDGKTLTSSQAQSEVDKILGTSSSTPEAVDETLPTLPAGYRWD